MSYAFMLALETAPSRYERGMAILTLGRLARVRDFIAGRVNPDDHVLEIGSGTGVLTAMMAEQGAKVVGIDISPAMLTLAERVVAERGLSKRVEFQERSAMELDTALADKSFDLIVSVLTFSELLPEEIDFTLAQCRRLLRPGGRLVVADEVWPASGAGRLLFRMIRLPFALAAYAVAQTSTRPVDGLEKRLRLAGFTIRATRAYLAGTFVAYIAEAANASERPNNA